MTADSLDRLAPTVVQFATERFALRDDLTHLRQVQQVGAAEAVILYCARILEVLAAEALLAVRLEASSNLFANLDTLQQFNLMPTTTRYWAHALRRTGNWVRHIDRKVTPEDADWSVVFAERCLDWFFRQFRFGPCLTSLTQGPERAILDARDELRALMEAFDDPDFNPLTFLELTLVSDEAGFFQNPAPPAVLAEMLLERKEFDAARKTIDVALAACPRDLRLRQLLGLYWTRTGKLDAARQALEALHAEVPDDEETAGIMAGVYKRYWVADPRGAEWLTKSQRAYRHGWERSKKSNTYLGINAATTALWLGRAAEARQLAAEVGAILRKRAAALARHAADRELTLNFWDQATLAEAELLLGNLAAAREAYRDAFARHAEQQGNIAVCVAQLDEILKALGAADNAAAFLAP